MNQFETIGICCLGRAGSGIMHLLESMSGRKLTTFPPSVQYSTPRLDCHIVTEKLGRVDGGPRTNVNIRFWTSRNMDEWTAEDVPKVMSDLQAAHAQPLVVIYCDAGIRCIPDALVTELLGQFVREGRRVMYAMAHDYRRFLTKDEFHAHAKHAIMTMHTATGMPGWTLPTKTPGTCCCCCLCLFMRVLPTFSFMLRHNSISLLRQGRPHCHEVCASQHCSDGQRHSVAARRRGLASGALYVNDRGSAGQVVFGNDAEPRFLGRTQRSRA